MINMKVFNKIKPANSYTNNRRCDKYKISCIFPRPKQLLRCANTEFPTDSKVSNFYPRTGTLSKLCSNESSLLTKTRLL